MKIKLGDKFQNFPDFLIVGAAKCGTSSLHRYLDTHPNIFMPHYKELLYWQINCNPNQAIFDVWDRARVPTTLLDYLAHFETAKEGQIVGEACPSYLYNHDYTIKTLKQNHPRWRDVKIIVILRDPVARILSQYRFVRDNDLDPESLTLEQALKREKVRLGENKILADNFYRDLTRYADQIEHFQSEFPNVKVYLFDELKRDSFRLVQDICEYVGVPVDLLPKFDNKITNKSSNLVPKHKVTAKIYKLYNSVARAIPFGGGARKLVRKVVNKTLMTEEDIPDHIVNQLKDDYLPELDRLERVIGKDLGEWKSKYSRT